jgi:iron complex outermembrane receptor protein
LVFYEHQKTNKMKNKFKILLLLVLIPAFTFAQFTLSGKIKNKNNQELLIGAHLTLNGHFKTVTDANGEFSIKNLSSGTYQISVSFIGFKTFKETLIMTKNHRRDFELDINPVLQDEVIILATRVADQSPTTYSNVDKKDIEEKNLGQDIPYMLQSIPSTVISSDAGAGVGYTGIRIRGTDITRINVTLNGIPLNDPESHGVFWVNMPDFSSSVESIQVQRGVGTSTNGTAAFGASINIETLNMKDEAYAEINSSGGSFNTFKNNLNFGTGLINGKFTFDSRVSKITSDGYIDRAFSDLKSYFISGAFYGKSSIVKINLFSGAERTYQAWNGVPKEKLETDRTYNSYTYENETDNYQQDHYQLLYSQKINSNILLNTAFHFTHGEGYYEQFKEGRDFSDYQLEPVIINGTTIDETDLIQQKWLDNNFYGLTYSLNYSKNNLNAILGGAWNKYKGDHFGEIIWAQFASNADYRHRWYSNTGDKTDFNIFAKATLHVGEKLNIYGDIQFRNINYDIKGIHDDLRDISQSNQFNFFNPKAGLFYEIDKQHSLYTSFAISNREPSRSDYRDADVNHQPRIERLLDWELGYAYKTPKASLNASFYFMNYKDQLVLTGEINDVGAAILTNVGKSYRAGIEISGGVQINSKLDWEFNATLSENKIKDFTSYVDNWSPPYSQVSENLGNTSLSFSPSVIAGSTISLKVSDAFQVRFISKYVSRQYIDNTANIERSLDPYFINNLHFEYEFNPKFIKGITARLMVNNIFNEKYESNAWVYRYFYDDAEYAMDGYFPQAGINFMAGLSLKF